MIKKSSKKKSGSWMAKQNKDLYVQRARARGYRARAYFKLEQIDKKYNLIQPHMNIIDLGSSPGSWCQYAASKISPAGTLTAVDLLPMEALAKVRFIQGDFMAEAVQSALRREAENRKFDLVLSDMAPNITGMRIIDQANTEQLQNAVLVFCAKCLNSGGALLSKVFEGEAVRKIKKQLEIHFNDVRTVKPEASRSASREIYLLARKFKSA